MTDGTLPTAPREARRERILVVGLALTGVTQLITALLLFFAPGAFYDKVAPYPPRNDHFLRDVGSFNIAMSLGLLVAIRYRRWRVPVLALWVVQSVFHLVSHIIDVGDTDPSSAGPIDLGLVALGLVLFAGLLRFSLEQARTPAPAAPVRPVTNGDGGARVPGVERSLNPIVLSAYRSTKKKMGRVGEPVRVTAHAPELLAGWGMFELASERADRVERRTKTLAVLKAAQLTGCEWCLDFGSAISRAEGIGDEELAALVDYRASDRFSETEKLVLDYATGMTRTPTEVSDELFDELRKRFDDAQLVELTSIIALENYRGRFNWALGIEQEGFCEGGYCVPATEAGATGGAATHEVNAR
jgi:4-carboxymuconolactone decarboxylase